jgi:hypothetical protein
VALARGRWKWIRDIADCRRRSVVPFHKQWGTYGSNPLVAGQGIRIETAKRADSFGKGGGLIDGELVRVFPTARILLGRRAA